MYKGRKILGIIPAKSGSKGIPQKNIRPLYGKPLIAWTIEQAKSNKYLDKVIVSTDDEEIAEISKKYGAEVPFLRSKELASDEAKMIDVILHALNYINRDNEFYDLFVLLQPTSPLRLSVDIDKAIELLFARNARAIVSVCEVDHHPYLANTLPDDGCMQDFIKQEAINKNRQELPNYFRINGAIYLAYCDYILKQRGFWGNATFSYIMPRERSIDIDDGIDFSFAEFLLEKSFKMKKF